MESQEEGWDFTDRLAAAPRIRAGFQGALLPMWYGLDYLAPVQCDDLVRWPFKKKHLSSVQESSTHSLKIASLQVTKGMPAAHMSPRLKATVLPFSPWPHARYFLF